FSFLGQYITILLGVVMFGMGLTLKPVDFKLVLKNPLSVIGGVLAQFIVMPIAAFIIAYLLNLPAELAAGLVLLGSVPGGTASNVMVYLARGNLPLSITMTSFSTMLAPIFTPLFLLLLAGHWFHVVTFSLYLLFFHIYNISFCSGCIDSRLMPLTVYKSIAVVPLISVIAIIIIVSAVVSGNVDAIANGGFIVFIAVVLHNGVGLLIGYFSAKLMRLTESERRAISIEVGMQNSGLGVALATAHFGALAALPSAIGVVLHNISGPVLASFWSKRTDE